jgi:hypothetical protein
MLRDIHGHVCCDSCGITNCGVHVVGDKLMKPQIHVIHCPFRFCKDEYLCFVCRENKADTRTRRWHRQNGCAAAAQAKAAREVTRTDPDAYMMQGFFFV